MRVQVSDPRRLFDLARYLRAAECVVEQMSEDTLEVSVPRSPSEAQAGREVEVYLKTWEAMNPAAPAHIVE